MSRKNNNIGMTCSAFYSYPLVSAFYKTLDVCTTVCGHGKSQSDDGDRLMVDTVSHFPNSLGQNGLARPVKQQMFCSSATHVLPKYSQWR